MSVLVLFIIVIALSVGLVLFAVKGSKWARRIGVSVIGAVLATMVAGILALRREHGEACCTVRGVLLRMTAR